MNPDIIPAGSSTVPAASVTPSVSAAPATTSNSPAQAQPQQQQQQKQRFNRNPKKQAAPGQQAPTTFVKR